MGAALLGLAETELLRFLRRRETFWTLLGNGASLLAVPVLLLGIGAEGSGLVADLIGSFVLLLEAACLWFLAIQGGRSAVRQELESGSWILLALTPNRTGRLWAGKLLGVSAGLVVTHAFLYLPVLAFTPIARRPHAVVFALFAWVLAWALTAIPEGMVYGLVGLRRPRLAVLLYAATALRFALPVPFLVAAASSDLLGDRPGLGMLAAGLLPVPRVTGRIPDLFPGSWVPFALVLALQLVSALPYWLAVRRTSR